MIIAHPGRAHRDDFLSICFIFALRGTCDVYRREPTEAELNDPDVFVIDIGGQFDASKNNYDHHQYKPPINECALSLLTTSFPELNPLRSRPWFPSTVTMDALGPRACANLHNMTEIPEGLWSPVEDAMLNMFSECSYIPAGGYTAQFMQSIGDNLLNEALDYARSWRVCETETKANLRTPFVLNENPIARLAINDYVKSIDVNIYAIVTPDDRGDGWTLYRPEEHTNRINFAKLDGHPDIAFAHNGGFIAKTKTKDVDVEKLIRKALC